MVNNAIRGINLTFSKYNYNTFLIHETNIIAKVHWMAANFILVNLPDICAVLFLFIKVPHDKWFSNILTLSILVFNQFGDNGEMLLNLY